MNSVSARGFSAATWNVQFGTHITLAADELARHDHLVDVDVLLLQEMDDVGTEWLAGQFGWNHTYHAVGEHRMSGRLFGNAVLSPHPVAALPPTHLPRSARFRGHPRHMTTAKIELPTGTVAVGSVHLETPYLGLTRRVEQLAAALDVFADVVAEPVLVGGDLNTFTKRARRHMARPGPAFTLHEPPAPTLTWRRFGLFLDHFLSRGLELTDSRVEAPTPASDHQAFWARFEPT